MQPLVARAAKHCVCEEVTEQLTKHRAPMTQLLGNGLKAEKTLKTAVEQLKKAAEKKQEKASKAKKANASPSIPIFDQGASMAILRLRNLQLGRK